VYSITRIRAESGGGYQPWSRDDVLLPEKKRKGAALPPVLEAEIVHQTPIRMLLDSHISPLAPFWY
jgi:hypothetical protein